MVDHTRRGRVDLLDYLRLFAALAVVFHHWLFNGIVNGKISSLHELSPAAAVARYGYLGVTLFFLISGYVIYGSVADKTPDEFAVGRGVRLYPAFWAALLATTVVGATLGGERFAVTPGQFAANTTMVPSAFGQSLVDGVYWTLAYELAFYAAIFVVMLLGRGASLHRLLPWWAILMAAVTVVSPALATKPFLGTYYAYFAGGAIIATFRRTGVTPLGVAGLAAAMGVSVDQAVRHVLAFETRAGQEFSPAVVVAVTLASYGLVLLLSSERAGRVALPCAALAGALTYPVYLLHAHIGYVVLSRWATPANQWLVDAALLAGVLGAAYGLHVLVERRPQRFWRHAVDATGGRLLRATLGPLARRQQVAGAD